MGGAEGSVHWMLKLVGGNVGTDNKPGLGPRTMIS